MKASDVGALQPGDYLLDNEGARWEVVPQRGRDDELCVTKLTGASNGSSMRARFDNLIWARFERDEAQAGGELNVASFPDTRAQAA